MKILLAGAGGMLGSALASTLPQVYVNLELHRFGRDRLAVAPAGRLADAVQQLSPDLVINAAADTDVDAAEDAPHAAFAANAELPAVLAQACRSRDIPLIHVSSTGCYGAWKETPYTDYDPLRPTTVHHKAKMAGEESVRHSGASHLIVRTGWLFGGDPDRRRNFVTARLREASDAAVLRSDPTQRGNPTFVDDLSRAILAAFSAGVRGTCNIVSGGSASRFDYVQEIVRLAGVPCQVVPSDQRFTRRAQVSPNEAADNFRLRLLDLDTMVDWKDQLARYITILRGARRAGAARSLINPQPPAAPEEQTR